MDDAMEALRSRDFHAIFADVGDFLPLERGLVGDKSSLVLNTIGEGVCIVDADGRCSWSNKKLRSFSPEVIERVKHICAQARMLFSSSHSGPLPEGTQAKSKKFAMQCGDRYFELMASPVIDQQGNVTQVAAVVWDATSSRKLQQKLDAIDSAGRELARLETEALPNLTPGQRLQLLRDKIIKFSKDLMHFDHFAIRLLDRRSNKLEVVIVEGLPSEAQEIDLYAQPEGNGISGYVAATGRSYICHDTEKDPRYVLGLEHCKSSLTVPLLLHDKVIGVYNIESETVGAFSEDDRQFAEIFGRYIAMALNILNLLVVERYTTTGQLADNVVQEMAQPLNDIITEAQTLMEEYIGDDTMRGRLNKIVEHIESIRGTLRDVAAGPKTILGSGQVKEKQVDPLLAGKRVLIADDEANIRKTIGDILSKYGMKPTICKDGYEAAAMLEQQGEHYDLVISDIKMPYRNGYEIFAAARRTSDHLPVILMTGFGYDPHHSIVRASQEGLASVLFKPFKVDQLIDEIRKALGGPKPNSEAAPSDAVKAS
ncbi:MAG: response regulator [Phycisphaeraceae bacterium]